MQRETLFWTVLMIAGGAALLARGVLVGNGRQYVEEIQTEVVVEPTGETVTLSRVSEVPPHRQGDPGVTLSVSRTIGIWVAAICTLGIFSFLAGDSPLYKFVESVFVGVSAAYAMVVGFWSEIVQNLLGNLFPDVMRMTVMPGISAETEPNYWYAVPLILSVMLLMRLSPKGGWIARWPLAFFIGATAGIRLIGYLEADFVGLIRSTILPLAVLASDGTFDPWTSLRHILIIVGVLMGLVYFFFSLEHKGVVGAVARGGVWLLMITFGASFGYTVMGRIALLADRLEFLFNDWLWLIDPAGTRGGI